MKAILTYHSIDDSGSAISISKAAFERHRRWLAGGSVRVCSVDELLGLSGDEPAVAVTFDDGIRNTGAALRALRDTGVPAMVFVVTGRVGEANDWGGRPQKGIPTLPLFDWDELGRLHEAGVALASHTRSHRSLTALSVEEAEADMRASSEDFRHRLGIACRHIAYPYGHVNRQVREAAGRHFESGQTTRFACLTDGDDRLRLPRLDAFYFRRAGALDRWGDSAFRRRVKWVQARRWLSRYVR